MIAGLRVPGRISSCIGILVDMLKILSRLLDLGGGIHGGFLGAVAYFLYFTKSINSISEALGDLYIPHWR